MDCLCTCQTKVTVWRKRLKSSQTECYQTGREKSFLTSLLLDVICHKSRQMKYHPDVECVLFLKVMICLFSFWLILLFRASKKSEGVTDLIVRVLKCPSELRPCLSFPDFLDAFKSIIYMWLNPLQKAFWYFLHCCQLSLTQNEVNGNCSKELHLADWMD